jgi:hypothetical protein
MYHTVYKITNIINGMIYIGKHSTNNLNDDYMGSGKALNEDYDEYGIENFTKEILFIFETEDEALEKEREIVNYEFIYKNDNYNLAIGGGTLELTEEKRKEKNRKAALKMNEINWNDPEFIKRAKKRSSNTFKKLHKEGKVKPFDWTGKKHTKESKKKMSKSHKGKHDGEKNSQYGTCWIHHLEKEENKKIKKEELKSYLNEGWIKGRKMKFNKQK